jgi:hypothetical protein
MSEETQEAVKLAEQVVDKAATVAQDLLKSSHEHALDDAKMVVDKAAESARQLLKITHEKSVEVASDALRRVFGENEEAKRFIDVSRIPLICKSIIDLNERSVENRIWQKGQATMMRIMMGLVSAIGVAVLGLIGALLLRFFTK